LTNLKRGDMKSKTSSDKTFGLDSGLNLKNRRVTVTNLLI